MTRNNGGGDGDCKFTSETLAPDPHPGNVTSPRGRSQVHIDRVVALGTVLQAPAGCW